MTKISFSQLPIWYRLTWVFGASAFIIVAYAILVFASIRFSDPSVGCWEVGKIQTAIPTTEWIQGKTYEMDNSVLQNAFRYPPKKHYRFYYYTAYDQGSTHTYRLEAFLDQCEYVNAMIGELYPEDFSIADEARGYTPDFFVDDNYIIFETLSGGK